MKCPSCNGRGRIEHGMFEIACSICCGTGEIQNKERKTRFEVITESPASLADFLIDVRCNVGHYKYNEYPPADDYEEMERWLNEECEWK